jgi:hypothetical protein
VQVKLALAAPLGQPQLMFPPQPLVMLPQALPSPCAGQTAGVQQALGFGVVLQTCPLLQPQLSVPPQPSLNEPQASPPGCPGPLGTVPQVYA